METVYIGADGFANEASREDDLGGGKMYAALIRQAVLKRLNQADANVATEANGNISTDIAFGRSGAVIANTADKSDIPMQLVCPVGFKADLAARIASETGQTIASCTVGEFLDCFCAQSDAANVPEWNTFAQWLNSQYRTYLNDAIQNAAITFLTIDGDEFAGTIQQMPTLATVSDILSWTKAMTPAALLAERVESITADNNPDKLGFICHMTNVGGMFPTLTGKTTADLHFYFRL